MINSFCLLVNFKKKSYPLSGDCLLVSWSTPAAPPPDHETSRGLMVNFKKNSYPLSGVSLLVS